MKIVLDASAAMQILQKTDTGAGFINILLNCDGVSAPNLYVPEISNALWKYARQRKDNIDDFAQMLEDAVGYIDEFISERELYREVFRRAHECDHPTYDMYYAILAKRNDATLLTCDKQLKKLCEKIGVSARR